MLLIKIGGGKNINLEAVCKDIAEIRKTQKVVLVHGANATRDEIAEKMGYPTKVVTSPSGVNSVFTDEKAIEVFLMAYPGLVNKTLVAKLQSLGVNAVGLSGVDGRLWEGKIKDKLMVKEEGKIKMVGGNFSGKVEKANTKVVEVLLENNFVPVITAPGIDYDGRIMNTDNDLAVSIMVEALGIKKIVSLFEAPGMLKDHTDPTSLIPKIQKAEIEDYLKYADGRMKKKILGVKEAMDRGVQKIYFGDARVEHPVLDALDGKGTIIE